MSMHEEIARALYYFEVHLLYASIVCLAAWALKAIYVPKTASRFAIFG
jgi:hypothetical protein